MARFVGVLVVSSLVLGGCSAVRESRVNPLNWFDREERTQADPENIPAIVPPSREVVVVDQRALVDRITELDVQDVSGGTLVTARGLISRPDGFNAQLVPATLDNGVLTLAMRIQYPRNTTAAGSKTVTISQFLTNAEMAGVRTIRVQAENGSLSRRN